jgi:dihydroflavonol-4-reductase
MAVPVSVLVTGGTGFFGHNLVAALLADPRVARIHVCARNAPPTENRLSRWGCDGRTLLGHGVEPSNVEERVLQSDQPNAVFADDRVCCFRGDICDEEALSKAAAGCTLVFHACGDTRWWNAKNDEQYHTNVQGTTVALRVALATDSVRAFVYTSTVDVMGHDPDAVLDENHLGYSYRGFGYHYADTKRFGEGLVLDKRYAFAQRNKRIIVLRASSMLGPWDVSNQYGRLFGELKQRSLAGVPCGGTSVCHVQDVARAHIAAAFAEKLEHSTYICAGVNVSYRQLFLTMRQMLLRYRQDNSEPIGGCCGAFQILPRWALVTYGWFCELHADYWSGSPPEINPGLARYMSCNAFYSSARAEHDLGYPDQESRWIEAIAESYAWYRRRGRF